MCSLEQMSVHSCICTPVHCKLQYLSKLLPADSLGAVNDVVYNLKEVL